MNAWDYCCLGSGGRVVFYFAPLDEVNVVLKNKAFVGDRKDGKGSIGKDKRIYRHEVTLQGEFVDAAAMPQDFRQAIQRLFGRGDVTAEMQWRWLQNLALYVGGNFDLKLGDDYYSATSEADLVYAPTGNRFPQVIFDEVRRNQGTNRTRVGYTVRFIAGFERSKGEEESAA